jgi:hypothetical protein
MMMIMRLVYGGVDWTSGFEFGSACAVNDE